MVGKHVDSSNPNSLLVPGQKPSSMFPGVSSQMSSRDSNLKKRTVDDSRMKQVSQMTGGNGGSQFYQTGDPAAVKKPGVKSRAPGGQPGARLPPGATGPISGTTGKPIRRVRDPNAPPRKQAEDIDSDIPDELLTES